MMPLWMAWHAVLELRNMFGWPLALGLVLSIYIHEMGHVVALMRYGVKATAPMFIPGVGAIIRLQQSLGDPRQDARCGLAGPLWGLGAALGSYGLNLATGLPIRWSETENVRWKTPIHDKGWSSPVVWGDQVWLTTAREDGKQMALRRIQSRDGDEVDCRAGNEDDRPAPPALRWRRCPGSRGLLRWSGQ